jgi:hypothetical protein
LAGQGGDLSGIMGFMKKLIIAFMVAVFAFPVFSQVISDSDLINSVKTVECFLNNRQFDSIYDLLSVNEWDPRKHNGYSDKCVQYLLDKFPYETITKGQAEQAKNTVTISLSPDKKGIIVVMILQGSYYAFFSPLSFQNGNYTISQIPYGLHEGD